MLPPFRPKSLDALQSEADEDMLDPDRHHKKSRTHDAETECDEDAAMSAEPKTASAAVSAILERGMASCWPWQAG